LTVGHQTEQSAGIKLRGYCPDIQRAPKFMGSVLVGARRLPQQIIQISAEPSKHIWKTAKPV